MIDYFFHLISAEVITRVIGKMENVTAWVSNAEESGSTEGNGRKGLKVRESKFTKLFRQIWNSNKDKK